MQFFVAKLGIWRSNSEGKWQVLRLYNECLLLGFYKKKSSLLSYRMIEYIHQWNSFHPCLAGIYIFYSIVEGKGRGIHSLGFMEPYHVKMLANFWRKKAIFFSEKQIRAKVQNWF